MPRLSDSMENGELGRWIQPDGALVRKGDPVAEIETDKTTVELQADGDGTLRHLCPRGSVIPVGECFGVIVGEDDPDEIPEAGTLSNLESVRSQELKEERAEEQDGVKHSPSRTDLKPTRVRATPAARRVAAELGINLASLIPGSGPHGRVHRIDVERAVSTERTADARASEGAASAKADTVVTPSRIHLLTARRTAESKQTIPHFYVSTVTPTAAAEELRHALDALQTESGVTITDIILAACAQALRVVPEVNSSWLDGQVVQKNSINIGVAVALEDGGLMVPVVHEADTLRLSELARTTRSLIRKARQGALQPADLDGASFTVSNLGMYGITEFHAIINPPESAILAIGAIQTNLVLRHGEVEEERSLTLSLSADHRAYSGATAARFMQAVKDGFENPLTLLV